MPSKAAGQLGEALEKARAERAARSEPHAQPAPSEATDGGPEASDGGVMAMSDQPDPEPGDEAGASPGLFYDPAYRDRLGALVAGILREQGPLREDRLVQAVARLHGFGRAGREIRDRVMAVLPDTSMVTTEDIGRFIWPQGTGPTSWNTFRAPTGSRAVDPAELPLPELVALARRCMAPDVPEQAIPIAMREACGLQRLGEASRARCFATLALARL